MTRTSLRWMISLGCCAALLSIGLAVFGPEPSTAANNDPQRIKLYEGGKLVAEWTSEGQGRMDGDSYVFTVRKGVSSDQVRIRGTFTAEPVL